MQQQACATFPTLALGGNLVTAGFGFGFGFGFGLELGLSPWWHTPVRTSYLIRVTVRVKAACY